MNAIGRQATVRSAVEDMEITRIGELAEHRGLDAKPAAIASELVDLFRRHGQAHPLLGLGNQDFPRVQSRILEGRLRQVHPAAAALGGHLAHGRGKPAGAVIGDETIKALVPGTDEEVEHPLLGDRVADLHRADRRVLVEFLGGKGGAMDAVLADAAAGHDDQVAGVDLFDDATARRLSRAGMIPAVPQKTRGLPAKRWSKTSEPLTVGMPLLLPPCSTPSTTPS